MIVIGVDTHKRNPALAAVHRGTGVVVDELQIAADGDGHLQALDQPIVGGSGHGPAHKRC